jgi:hypothetical protein
LEIAEARGAEADRPVLMLDRAAYVLKERSGEALRDRREELTVVAEAHRQGPREGEHPLAVADRTGIAAGLQRRDRRRLLSKFSS